MLSRLGLQPRQAFRPDFLVLGLPCLALAELGEHGTELPGGRGFGIGALAVGNVKYQTQKRLFQRMLESDTPLCLDFRDAYPLAVEIAG